MRTITIHRKKTVLKPAAYYFVYCDEKLVASVPNGQSASFETDDEAHILYFEIHAPMRHGRGGTARSNVLPLPAGTSSADLYAYRTYRAFHLDFTDPSSDKKNKE